MPAANNTKTFELWSDAGRSAELHIHDQGEHGLGMRLKGLPVDHWPAAFEAWLGSLGPLSRAESNTFRPTP